MYGNIMSMSELMQWRYIYIYIGKMEISMEIQNGLLSIEVLIYGFAH